MSIYDVYGNIVQTTKKPIIYDCFEVGSLSGYVSNGVFLNSSNYTRHRSKYMYHVIEEGTISVTFDDTTSIQKVQFICYNSDFSTITVEEKSIPENSNTITTALDGYAYFKVLIYHSTDVYTFNGAWISSTGIVEKVFHPNMEDSSYASIGFNYVVFDRTMASGRLMLPPNYTLKGQSVPLVCYVHGSGGIPTWSSPISDSSAKTECFRYLTNEGFAVFDCFSMTDKPTVTGNLWNPFQTPLCMSAYIEGIKYVCSHFNVDADKVVLCCKSQGGNIGHWAITETKFPFKAIALHAPTTDPVLQKTNVVFYNENCRNALLQLIDFDGTETEKSAFVSSGLLTNSDVVSFLEKNKGLIVALMPYARGLQGAQSVDELYDGGIETLTAVPQWLLDLGLPARQTAYDLIPKFAEKSYYSKNGQRPAKFWCAIDDAQTSTYGNYAIYQYLLNGGSDAEFRFMTVGTGGHNSMDTSSSAEKTSGTTSLGIAYSNIAVGMVETAEFFHRYV